jgi:NADH dehydrogenase
MEVREHMDQPECPTVVILGGGFGGAYCAAALEKEIKDRGIEIILIDRHNYFTFYPLLVEAGTGSLEPRHAVVSIRKFLHRTAFRMAEVDAIDFRARRVSYRIRQSREAGSLAYDHLVLALGSVTRLPDIPGLREFGLQMKSLTDAVGLRDRVIQLLEAADATMDPTLRRAMLSLIVVGGNYTGAEVAGEFDVFFKEASRYYKNVRASDCRVTLIEIADRILGALEPELSDYALARMRRRGIDVRLETSVSRIEENQVTLSTGEVLAASTVVWCAGIAPNPLIARMELPVDKRGYILCQPDLRVQGFDNVWAIGDGAVNGDPQGRPYPATAQHAVGQARRAARNIARVLAGAEPQPCVLADRGSLAALGCRTAVAKLFGLKLSGFWAWFLWRTVYLAKMPGWARRLRVALDWTVDLFFRRDYVQLGAHRLKDEG